MLNLGQVVPHEALGMANYTKNLFIGVAGAETINLTHHITAYFPKPLPAPLADLQATTLGKALVAA